MNPLVQQKQAQQAAQSSPTTSGAPSPTGSDDRRLPRPIGIERPHKKPTLPGYGPMGETGPASNLWSFQTGKRPDIL